MKPAQLNNKLIKTVLLITVLVPYIISFTNTEVSGFLAFDVNQKAHSHWYEIDNSTIAKIYLLPQNTLDTILPEKLIPISLQPAKSNNQFYRNIEYYHTKIFEVNHPIPAFKISLSAYTSGG